jgi:hypothetical protein
MREPERALPLLERAGAGADVDSDRAAAALLAGHPEDALRFADAALKAQPAHPQALWNRALALRDLHRTAEAFAGFAKVTALGERGWSGEARMRALTLGGRAP